MKDIFAFPTCIIIAALILVSCECRVRAQDEPKPVPVIAACERHERIMGAVVFDKGFEQCKGILQKLANNKAKLTMGDQADLALVHKEAARLGVK